MVDPAFKREVFELVRARLLHRSDSLVRFFCHWHGTASGIEGWFKLEFAAAIEPHIAIVRTGSAGGRGRGGKNYPDLILETSKHGLISIETKAACNSWHYGDGDIAQKYKGCLLAFLSRSLSPIKPSHELKVKTLDSTCQIAKICDIQTPKSLHALYFCIADLT